MEMMTNPQAKALRDLAWNWDPLCLGSEWRDFGEDEYDCILDEAMRGLTAGASTTALAAHLETFLATHFEIKAQPEQAAAFADRLHDLWSQSRHR
jgi:hypothetical protein